MTRVHKVEDGLAAERINTARDEALGRLAIDEENAHMQLALGNITQEQLLQQKREFENRKSDIERQALEQRATLVDPSTDPVAYVQAMNRIQQIKRQHNLAMMQIDREMVQQMTTAWQSVTDRIASLWDKGVQALMNGTLTWRGATKAIGAEMVSWFANDVIKKQLAAWILGENAKTGATVTGVAIRGAAEAGASAQSIALWAMTAAKNILTAAWEAMAGAYKAIVGIPYVGPVLAPVAAGVAFGAVAALAGNVASAEGGYDIPAGVNPMTQLHEKEMVLPAKYAEPMRGMLENGGGGGNVLHYHDHSGRLTKADIERNAGVIVKVLKDQHRNFSYKS